MWNAFVMSMEKNNIDTEHVEISIPKDLAEKIKKRIQGTEFPSISSYIVYVLKEIISDSESEKREEFTKEDEERVKERLRSLGYLD